MINADMPYRTLSAQAYHQHTLQWQCCSSINMHVQQMLQASKAHSCACPGSVHAITKCNTAKVTVLQRTSLPSSETTQCLIVYVSHQFKFYKYTPAGSTAEAREPVLQCVAVQECQGTRCSGHRSTTTTDNLPTIRTACTQACVPISATAGGPCTENQIHQALGVLTSSCMHSLHLMPTPPHCPATPHSPEPTAT